MHHRACCWGGANWFVLLQVQTLYYLGPAGSARKRTAAAAAQGSNDVTPDGAAAAAAAVPAAEEAGSKKGGKRGKRRKRGAAAAEAAEDEATAAAEKENELPGPTAADGTKAVKTTPAEQPEVRQRMANSIWQGGGLSNFCFLVACTCASMRTE